MHHIPLLLHTQCRLPNNRTRTTHILHSRTGNHTRRSRMGNLTHHSHTGNPTRCRQQGIHLRLTPEAIHHRRIDITSISDPTWSAGGFVASKRRSVLVLQDV
jgi:hypothetical protein